LLDFVAFDRSSPYLAGAQLTAVDSTRTKMPFASTALERIGIDCVVPRDRFQFAGDTFRCRRMSKFPTTRRSFSQPRHVQPT